MGKAFGAELDQRLYTDLSKLTPENAVTSAEEFYIRTGASRLLDSAKLSSIAVGGLVQQPFELSVADLAKQAKPMGLHLMECAGNVRAVHFGLMSTSYGVILRGSGGNPAALAKAGWSLLKVKMVLFALTGLFGVLSGMALIGITTSADANIGNGYTLLAIAGVILGGGEFVGGRVSPIGAVIGALTLALAASPLLTFMHIPPDWQVAANGAILIIVLAARALISRREG